jgi:hypothetical protein
LDELLSQHRENAPHSRDGRWQRAAASSAFEITTQEAWRWSNRTDVTGVIKRVRSVSYVAALPENEQVEVDDRVRAILRFHDGWRRGDPVSLRDRGVRASSTRAPFDDVGRRPSLNDAQIARFTLRD